MNKLIIDLNNSERKLKKKTIDGYLCIFKKLIKFFFKSKQFQSYTFLKNTNEIMNYINTLSFWNQDKILKSICVVLNINGDQCRSGYRKELKFYQKVLTKQGNEYRKKIAEGFQTDKEITNWLNWIVIKKHTDELYTNFYEKYYDNENKCKLDLLTSTKNDLFEAQRMFILGLYVFLPPRRLEIASCLYITIDEFKVLTQDQLDYNVYLVHINKTNNFISYGKFKIKMKTKTNLQIKLTKKLNYIYRIFIDLNYYHRSESYGNSLLFNSRLTIMSNASLSIYLTKHFKKHFNKEVSVIMLRKAYHTHFSALFKEENKKMIERANQMNHSVKTACLHYCKA